MPNANSSDDQIARLLDIMTKLRHPTEGCPWDVEQTMDSLVRYTIEETYEVADAIASNDMDEIRDELGDLLFQVVFYARIAEETGHFDFNDVAKAISDKLVRRHPHVFSAPRSGMDQVQLSAQWDAIKAQEKAAKKKSANQSYLLDSVPSGLPALMYAQKLQKACAKVGFDWPEIAPVLDKVKEELDEIQQELVQEDIDQSAIEEEIGDALFAMVNLARHAKVDADSALRKASHKFALRFNKVEQLAAHQDRTLDTMTLDEMEALWQQVKSLDK
ncbi:nucleoside triphosphate pyrophosphohydrolase [Alteromonas sp. KUL49]|uniref:nucleoside triphosphate pyrophosphohydrolase n=1 Tax=Alteromonas sp. KUL49 TaxID=2480798 RepID=UPI00102F07CA|nr:nucleoside triphosphate pyrophosphohydrolase [Alteromonas sp. KUL49]TAP38890.1 nucleoside triphosphate pyrophosphohydrolase [Alteromonas sp. KUL49]GEA12327.1 nucleoside triphosphate pyrophosphohydrolase [Alteromonas sp. KUL49]